MSKIPHNREALLHVVRAAFHRVWTRSTLTLLGFVALAAVFWLTVSLNETYEVEIAVPLELRDVPKNVVITTELPKELHVTLRDKGVRLLPYLYGPARSPIIVSYKEHTTGNGRGRFTVSELLGQLQRQIVSPTQIVRVKPDTLEFFYNFGASKRVPVRLDGEARCQTGYFVEQVKFAPEFVTIYAPQNVLDTLRTVHVSSALLESVRDTLKKTLPIITSKGMKAVPSNVNVTVVADRLTEKTVQVPIRTRNFPANRVLRTFPSVVNVTFKVGVNHYDEIGQDNFVVAFSYDELQALGTTKARPVLSSIPEGAYDVRISPTMVEYVIETTPEEEN